MGVVRVTETSDREGQINYRLRKYVRTFRVLTDDSLDDAVAVLAANLGPTERIPADAEPFPTDTGATVQERRAAPQEDHPRLWLVTVTYEASTGELSPAGNPLLRRPEIEISGVQTVEPIEVEPWHVDSGTDPRQQQSPPIPDYRQVRSVNNVEIIRRPIVNCVADRFTNPPVMVEVVRPQLTITRNEDIYINSRPDAAILYRHLAYRNAINVDRFRLLDDWIAPRTCRMAEVGAVLAAEQGFTFWRVSYTMEFDDETFLRSVANRGMNEWLRLPSGDIDANSQGRPRKKEIVDDAQRPISEPAWLRLDGSELKKGPDTPFEDFQYLVYHVYREAAFDALNLPRYMTEIVSLQP